MSNLDPNDLSDEDLKLANLLASSFAGSNTILMVLQLLSPTLHGPAVVWISVSSLPFDATATVEPNFAWACSSVD